ncbi:unnamed protein product [Brassicogethes aeneus]|uniref:Uncharacterized protein n=1 Tax=Brassicogethes aeneus TaxID=1431903 RepID=A0A9P0API3_BRAAE|nr:unnamed protein product [Brassicogethes aeneus]
MVLLITNNQFLFKNPKENNMEEQQISQKVNQEVFNLLKKIDPLFFEENRLLTFKSWVFKDNKPCSAQKLAEAGFIFYGTKQDPDTVKCFFCDKTLDGWEEMDCPWSEHESHAPYCNYAKLRTSNLRVEDYINLRKELLIKIKNKFVEDKKIESEEALEEILDEMET